MMKRWSIICALAVVAGLLAGSRLTVTVVSHALDIAQIVGVFAGLGLTAISIMAALPLDSWILRMRKKNHELANGIIKQLENLPKQFRAYLFTQIVAIGMLAIIGLASDDIREILKPNQPLTVPVPIEWYWTWIVGVLSAITVGVTTFCCFAAWDTFILLHKISEKSIGRYKEIGINADGPVTSLAEKKIVEAEPVQVEITDPNKTSA